ncbi:MAG: DMT family transporter [Chitinophagales bacterium]
MFSKGIKHMLLAGVFFSIMNVCVKYLQNIPAIEIVFFRSLITLVISAVMIKRMNLSFFGNNKKILFLRGFFGVLALYLYFSSLQNMPLASAVTIQQMSPIFTSILAIFILKESLALPQWAFYLISFVGVALIKGFNPDLSFLYFFLALASAVFSALAYNMVRKLKDSDHPLVVVFYFPLVAMPLAGIFSFMYWVQPSWQEYLLLLGVGVSTQIAQVNLTKALQLEEMAKVSIVQYQTIIYAIIFGLILFDEQYSYLTIIGIILVIGGMLANIWYSKYKKPAI